MGESALLWAECQDVLPSAKAVLIHCDNIWILKERDLLVRDRRSLERHKRNSSGMPLKKDPGDWRSERRKGELLFTGYPFVLIFFSYVNAFFPPD